MTHIPTSRGIAALAVLAAVALGTTTACASSTTAGPGTSVPASAPPTSVVPVPSGATPGSPSASVPPAAPTAPGGGASTGTKGPAAKSYSAAGTVLTVYFYGGICEKYGLVADQSDPKQVKISVRITQGAPAGKMCPMLAQLESVSTDLGSPLNGRTVLDTVSGTALPQLHLQPGGKMTHGPVKGN